MEYTKGEWKQADKTGVIVCNGRLIAHVAYDDEKEIHEAYTERQTNVNLIASIPDMYEALKAFIQWYQKKGYDRELPEYRSAEQSLSKAEGR